VVTPIQIEEQKFVMATLCKEGEDLVILSQEAVPAKNLIYFGLNAGLPFLGYEITYNRLRNGKPYFHLSLAEEGSLGGYATTIRSGYHFWDNAWFVGGTTRVMTNQHNTYEYMLGPTFGVSGSKKLITGHVGVGLLGSYNQTFKVLNPIPELTMGIRLRLIRFGSH